ncbi:MAG: vacuolar family H+-ATPase subunit H [Clostridia bacterium]|nr:vacuolar family H+-ATPase subunit H [Clostridia bacterium]
MSRIEQIVMEIEEYIDNCKPYPFSGSKIIVNKDEMDELLGELRRKMPQEITKYKKLIENKEAIISDAKEQAENIINAAQVHTEELINEHEIMQRAYEQANQTIQEAQTQAQAIVDRAAQEANEMRSSAVNYTDQMLENLQIIIQHSVENNRNQYNSLMSNLEDTLNVVINNRNELRSQNEYEQTAQEDAE